MLLNLEKALDKGDKNLHIYQDLSTRSLAKTLRDSFFQTHRLTAHAVFVMRFGDAGNCPQNADQMIRRLYPIIED